MLARRRLERRVSEEPEEERERQVQRARLGVVQDPEAERERQRRGVPELEQRPGDRDAEDELAGETGQLAAAGVGFGDELLEIGAPRLRGWRHRLLLRATAAQTTQGARRQARALFPDQGDRDNGLHAATIPCRYGESRLLT